LGENLEAEWQEVKRYDSEYIPSIESLRAQLKAWNAARNEAALEVKWQFRTDDARIKLKRLYPNV